MPQMTLDERQLQQLPEKDRRRLQSSPDGGKAKKQQKKKKKAAARGKVVFFVVYGVACAVGGIWLDRHWIPQARVWLGMQAQTLSEVAVDQQIRGFVEQSDLAPSERDQMYAAMGRVYQAKRAGRLDPDQSGELAAVEAVFERAAATNRPPSTEQVRHAVEVFKEIASDL